MSHAERPQSPELSDELVASSPYPSGIQRLKQVYNTYLVSHRKRHRLLSEHQGGAVDALDDLEIGGAAALEPVYPVKASHMTFAQLYERTSRIVGSVLCDVYGMTDPDDVDDCLQSGYLKVWQKLQADPQMFKDKPIRYVVTAVLLRSKVQRFAHIRHHRKMASDFDPNWLGSVDDLKAHRVDTWIDLADAIATVAHAVMEKPVDLLALYTLITQAKAQHVRKLYGHSSKAITQARKRVRATLAGELPGYGPRSDDEEMLVMPVSQERETVDASVISQILEGIFDTKQAHTHRQRPADPERQLTSAGQGRSRTSIQAHIRTQIRPFRSEQRTDPIYETGWNKRMRLSDLMADPQVRKAAYAKAYQLGLSDEADIADCVQRGFVRLWQKLEKTPDLLADKGPVWAGIYVAFSGDTKRIFRHNQRQQRFTDPDFDWETADEHLQMDSSSNHIQPQAKWSVDVDETVDIAAFMGQMAEVYAEDFTRLVGLYALTTSVQFKDAASMLSIAPNNYNAQVGRKVRQEVQVAYQEYVQQSEETML